MGSGVEVVVVAGGGGAEAPNRLFMKGVGLCSLYFTSPPPPHTHTST